MIAGTEMGCEDYESNQTDKTLDGFQIVWGAMELKTTLVRVTGAEPGKRNGGGWCEDEDQQKKPTKLSRDSEKGNPSTTTGVGGQGKTEKRWVD